MSEPPNLLYAAKISNNIASEAHFLHRFHCRLSVVTYRCSRLACITTGNTAAILVDPSSEVQQSLVELSQEFKKKKKKH